MERDYKWLQRTEYIQRFGSAELKALVGAVTDHTPPGHNPITGKPYEIKWRRKKDAN